MQRPDPSKLSTAQRFQLMREIKASLAKNPKNANARMNYGLLLREENKLSEAIVQLTKAHKLARKDLEILSILAEACFEGQHLTEARKYSRKLCEIAPQNIHYLMFYGDVLIQMAKPDIAASKFEAILKLEPDNLNALKKLLETANMQGQQKKIDEIQRKIRQIDPLDFGAIYHEANTQKNTIEDAKRLDADIEQSLAKVSEEKIPFILYFAKGKIWSDAGDYDKAFEAYIAANLHSSIAEEDLDKHIFKNAKALLTKEYITQRAPFGIDSAAPVFIFGMPRSGTTLTESLCGAHSKVTAGDELGTMSNLFATFGGRSPATEAFVESGNLITKDEIKFFGKSYMSATAHLRTHTPHFTDKMPHNFLKLGFMKMTLPNASFIHCRRHPIDNCISIFTNSMNAYHNRYKHDLTTLGLYYRQYWQLMQFWRENVPGGFHEIYYEDVVANTEMNARKMMDYIGLDWEDTVLDRQRSQKSVRTLSAWQVRQPVYTSSAGRWKKYEKHLGPLIDALGPVIDEYEAELAALGTE